MRRILLLAVLSCSCGEKPDGLMSPGEDCLTCHVRGGSGSDTPWTAAGTVYASATDAADAGLAGVTIIITGGDGKELRLTSNKAGNFYTLASLRVPFTVAVERNGTRTPMSTPLTSGACSHCHADPPLEGAKGRVYAP